MQNSNAVKLFIDYQHKKLEKSRVKPDFAKNT